MVIKLNNKPIKIEEEPEKSTSIPYICVSTIGILLSLWILDLVAYTFFYIHPFPFTSFITTFFNWLGGL